VGNNLSRDEAMTRASMLLVTSYQVELDVHGSETSFESATTVRFECMTPGAESFIDLTALAVTEVTLNGVPLPLSLAANDRIRLPGLARSNELKVRARCAYSRTGEGLHRFADPADGRVYLYSNLETCNANQVFACFDQPDLKATFEFKVRCEQDWVVISNVPPQSAAQPTGKPGIVEWRFPPTPPISTYITAIAAGPYHAVTSEHDGIPLGLYCRESLASYLDSAEIFEITTQGLDFYHAFFGIRYPFAKYDQLFVPEFNSGAMENAGAVTVLEEHLFRSRVTSGRRESRAETLLHEMAHMWFGDLVTMTWWDDLWLNESFATWASLVALTEATRWTNAWTTFSQELKAWAYRQDQLPSTHPVVADITDIETAEAYFDGITYAKGAAVLKQLVAFTGREAFAAGLRTYFERHAWGNATLADLLDALEQASGRPLADWSKAWLETAGVNTLRPVYATTKEGTFSAFAVLQEAPHSHQVLRPHRIAIGLYDRVAGGLTRRRRVELDVAGERTEVRRLIGEPVPDLVLVNDDDLTFAKIRLDERSLRTVIEAVGDFTEPLPRALCLAAAWDMCRDAELPARDFVALVLSAAAVVGEMTVLQTILSQAATAVRSYADPGWRQAGLGVLATGLRELLLGAAPGSDRQLALAQAFIAVASSPDELALLTDLRSGAATIDGLVVDTDLRWQLLRRLVNRGSADAAAIEAERERDSTDAGARHAQACLASLPDPAAKEAAWQQILSGDLPNATFRAVVNGFQAPDQDDLLAPYAARFFDVVADKWQEWGPDMSLFFVERCYPSSVISQQAIDQATSYLARTSPPPALARLLQEGRDDVIRALKCRERDAGAS
jgi:aminopeptidase N